MPRRGVMAGPPAALWDILVAVLGAGEPLPAHAPARTQLCCRTVSLRAPASAEQPVLAGGHPGPGQKKLFWRPAHAPFLMELCWAVASPSQRGGEHRGALTLISFTNIKRLSKAEMMPCHHHCRHDSSICFSTTGAEPQCTITTRCQHHCHLHCLGPAAWHSHLPRDSPAEPASNGNGKSPPAASDMMGHFIRHA